MKSSQVSGGRERDGSGYVQPNLAWFKVLDMLLLWLMNCSTQKYFLDVYITIFNCANSNKPAIN